MISKQQYSEWLKRLRSGEYKQGKGALKILADETSGEALDTPRYCCLGVLAEILCEQNILDAETYDAGEVTQQEYYLTLDTEGMNDAYDTLLPTNILGSQIQSPLATANDSGKPFAMIADMIETLKQEIVQP